MLAVILTLAACALQQPNYPEPPPLLISESDVDVEEVDLLAVTPAMRKFLEEYIWSYSDIDTRLYLLTLAVTSSGVLGFDYDESRTLTAADAFETRSGNCIGFSNLMVALARESGLRASYQEVYRQPEWTAQEDTILLVKHINVLISSPRRTYIVDVSGYRTNPETRRAVITDLEAKTLYLNNLGAEALLENDLARAYAYLAKAIDLAPQNTDSWVNLGVVYGRNDQLDDAEMAFQTVLKTDPGELSAMSNLYEVYMAQENFEAAERVHAKVDRYRRKNPYYLMKLSEEERELGRYSESIALLERAIKKKGNDHMLYYELAKTQYLSGETVVAQNSLLRARELAPQHLVVHYNQPLEVLVAEE